PYLAVLVSRSAPRKRATPSGTSSEKQFSIQLLCAILPRSRKVAGLISHPAPKLLMARDIVGGRLVADALQTPTLRQKSVLISGLEVGTSNRVRGSGDERKAAASADRGGARRQALATRVYARDDGAGPQRAVCRAGAGA